MMVYRLKKDFTSVGGVILHYKAGWIFCEGEGSYYNPSYPIPKSWIDDRFDFLFLDTEHDKDYYIQPVYTEYQLQEILKSKQ